jgi:hypothetical protein
MAAARRNAGGLQWDDFPLESGAGCCAPPPPGLFKTQRIQLKEGKKTRCALSTSCRAAWTPFSTFRKTPYKTHVPFKVFKITKRQGNLGKCFYSVAWDIPTH